MANKDALRELQVRLANRLREARETPRTTSWLAVECAQFGLLIPLAQAGEIHPIGRISKLPHAKQWLLGVVNLRGELFSAVDLSTFLGWQVHERIASTGQLVALNASLGINAALRVDRLVGLRDAGHMTQESDDQIRPAFVTANWRDPQGRLWLALDLQLLVVDPMFLDVTYRPQPNAQRQ